MAGRERPKRKALHRGLDDIINRDASLTSRLLGRVKPPSRDSLDDLAPGESQRSETEAPGSPAARGREEVGSPTKSKQVAAPVPSREAELTSNAGQTDDRRAARAAEKRSPSETLTVAQPPPPASLQRTPHDPGKRADQSVTPSVAPVRQASPSFKDFVERWGFILRSGGRAGKLRICEVLYNNTYAIGRETFFTSYEKLAKLTDLEKKQCSINIRQLESLGFVERLNIFNTATKQGTEFKLHLEQLPPGERRTPRYHCYDEDLR
jgi:hypothetical protein